MVYNIIAIKYLKGIVHMGILKGRANEKTFLVCIISITLIFSIHFNVYAQLPSDINEHWASSQIVNFIDMGYIKGYPDGSFLPDSSIKRAEFFAIINRVYGFSQTANITFSDVPKDAWYAPDIAKAIAAGYISGYPDNTVKPENTITRQEVAVIIVKINGIPLNEEAVTAFGGKEEIPQWSRKYVGAVVAAGIMKGYPDGTFGATKPITRAEAVVSTANAVNLSPEPSAVPIPGSSGGTSGGNVQNPTPTPTQTSAPLGNLGGALVVGGVVCEVTMVVSLAKLNSLLGISQVDAKSGAKKIAAKVNAIVNSETAPIECLFEYDAQTDTMQAFFISSEAITEVQANQLIIYVKQ